MVDVVGLRFVTEGEKEAIASLRLYEAGIRQLSDIQDKHVAAMNRAMREQMQASRAALDAQRSAATAYAGLRAAIDPAIAASQKFAASQKVVRDALAQNLITQQEARATLARLQQQYEAGRQQRFADEQRRISTEIINGNAAVNRINASYQTMVEKVRAATLSATQHRAAELALARELATVNGYIAANGALNTQKALAELRAAQATRDATAADAAAAATKARLTQSYNQLLASVNPTIARQQQTKQVTDMLRAAVNAQAISVTQAAQALLQYRAHLQALNPHLNQAALGMNRTAVLTQQAGYQVGDFFVQIQSGTNVLVAFGQQATQLIGTFAMLATTARTIAILSGVGVLVAIGTAIGAAFMRANTAAKTLKQSLEALETAYGRVNASVSQLANTDLAETYGNLTPVIRELTGAMLLLEQAAAAKNLRETLTMAEESLSPGFFQMAGRSILAATPLGGSVTVSPETLRRENFDELGLAIGYDVFNSMIDGMNAAAAMGDTEAVTRIINDLFQQAIPDEQAAAAAVAGGGAALLLQYGQVAKLTAETLANLDGSAVAAAAAAVSAQQAARAEEERLDKMIRLQAIMGGFIAERRAAEESDAAAAQAREVGLLDLALRRNVLTEERRNDAEALAAFEETFATQEEARLAAAQAREVGLLDLALRRNVLTEERRNDTEALAALEAASAAAAKESDDARVNAIAIMVQMAIERADAEKEVADEAQRLAEELADSYQSALGIATVDMAAGVARAADAAAVLAERMGISLVSATRLAALSQMGAAEQRVAAGVIAGTIPPVALNSLGLTPAQQAALGGAAGALTGAPTPSPITLPPVFVPGVGGTGSGTGSGAGAAGGGSDALRKREEEVRRLYESTRTEAERYAAELGKVQQLYTSGAIDGDIYRRALEELNKKFDPFTKLVEGIANTVENELNAAFAAVLKGTASLGEALLDFASNVLAKVAQDLFAQQFAGPISSGLTSILGSALGSLGAGVGAPVAVPRPPSRPFADGGVFGPGGLTAFAMGGVVSGPTVFPFANGIGLMGEAGPEAIMPLARGSDGRLGVTANGGGSAPTVTINNYTGQEATTSTDSAGNLLIEIGRAVAQDITSGGPAYRAIRTTFGLANRLQQRG